jgi:hypothetical protein
MEYISVLHHYMVSLLESFYPYHVLVVIVSNRVEFLLEGIKKIHPSEFYPKCCRLIYDMSILVIVPPIFDMGKGLKECEGDHLVVEKYFNRIKTL